MLAFLETQVANAVSHEALTVFPMFAPARDEVNYLLSPTAIAEGAVIVEEVNEAGSVRNLVVHNRAECPVLFLEGEELRGAKQNRVLNTSVLVAAQSKTTIPVSCVERGRWRYKGHYFTSGGAYASSKLRYALKKSVSESAKEGRGHGSDQTFLLGSQGPNWFVKQGTYWTRLNAVGGHPNGTTASGGRLPIEQWAVRRWVSDVTADVHLAGTLAKINTRQFSNGVQGHIFVNRAEVWSQYISGQDAQGVDYDVAISVQPGDVIDFALDPFDSNDIQDGSRFTAVIF
jgi:hypothetical protein